MSGIGDLTDEELVLLSKNGSLDAFNRLVERHQSAVYAVTYRLLGERTAAEDATQETFIAAFRALHGFRSGSVRAWLLRIAANQAKDQLRARRRRPALSLEAQTSAAERTRTDTVAEDPVTAAEQRARRSALQQALLELPFEQRAVVVLIDVQGYGYEEASRVLGEPVGTVKSRLFRARRRLRELLLAQAELFGLEERREGRGTV
ncbi:ECF RNA polymerase sigma factor SigE [bacterium HR29]|jgi:RNA polymerase sigma-70 factor (ECF subfamily)|nr:ECF RNA polymerase sigma factor SigE [bacterium HR29]